MKLLLTLNWDELPEGKFRFSRKFGSTALIRSDRLFPSGKSPTRGKLGAPVNKSKQDWKCQEDWLYSANNLLKVR